jgi:hypothetical protein
MARSAAAQVVEIDRSETPEEKFLRLANPRVNHILDHLRILGNLSNRANYSYTDEQITRIFEAIETAVGETKAFFRARRKKAEFRVQS